MKQVVILGATGSVGASTLDVLIRHLSEFNVLGLSAHTQMDALAQLILIHKPSFVCVPDEMALYTLKAALQTLAKPCTLPKIFLGTEGLCQLATLKEATHVVAAIVGAAGLPSCIAAADTGKCILLANKEAVVMGGRFFLEAVAAGGATLLPLDSEHNALFQCLPMGAGQVNDSVKSVWLTASGGPFLNRDPSTLTAVTPNEACKHPKWSMGRKISVDSATLMNKGLEVIEAALLFGLTADQVKVVIHPQSTIHALVQYADGSLLSHLSHPDMRVPIAHALAYPDRIHSGVNDLDMTQLGTLQFMPPDPNMFPCLGLAFEALRLGHSACIMLNAANEEAVSAFLAQGVRFTQIASIVEAVLAAAEQEAAPKNLSDVYILDAKARTLAQQLITKVDF